MLTFTHVMFEAISWMAATALVLWIGLQFEPRDLELQSELPLGPASPARPWSRPSSSVSAPRTAIPSAGVSVCRTVRPGPGGGGHHDHGEMLARGEGSTT